MTGLSGQSTDLKGKQLQLMLTCVPDQRIVGVLLNPDTPYSALALKQLQVAADREGVRLELLEVRRPTEFTPERMDALAAAGATSLFVIEDPLTSSLQANVVEQASRLRLATMTGLLDYVRSGGLMAYGSSQTRSYRRVADYVDKILRGVLPTDLPVEQPTKFELVINLKAAKRIGLEIPPSVLAIADDILE